MSSHPQRSSLPEPLPEIWARVPRHAPVGLEQDSVQACLASWVRGTQGVSDLQRPSAAARRGRAS
eukprot:3906741-Alexandrium_andersonii.AAC.1